MLQYKFPERAIHFDFHNMPGAPAIGEEFDGDVFGQGLRAAGVELITFFAKDCNGNAYYPTKIGAMHPGLKFDLVGEVVKSCRKYGINVIIYLNAGYDNNAGLAHRDWCKVDAEGRIAPPGNFYDKKNGYYLRSMCPNTGYKQYLLAMIEELLPYGMDGIFLDCYNTLPCYGAECIQEMQQAGMDIHNPADARKFADFSMHRWIEEINRFIQAKNPKINIYHNGLTYAKQLNHIEIEVLPNGGWGYDYLPAALHYSRTLKLPVLTMAGRFHASWGDVNGLRTQASQEFDFYSSIANGATCMIGDHFPAACAFQDAVYESARTIFDRVARVQKFVGGQQRILTEIAILDPGMRNFPEARYENERWNWCLRESVRGASRLLGELKQQFDIIDDQADFSGYRIIIIPEDVQLVENCRLKLTEFVKSGGKIISAGHGGYDRDSRRMIDGIYQGIEVLDIDPGFYNYILPEAPLADRLSRTMPIANYTAGGVKIKLSTPAQELATLFPSILPRDGFDGKFVNYYVAPDLQQPSPALAWNGHAAHFAISFFQSYYNDAIVQMKQLFANLLQMLLPCPMIQCDTLPSFGRVTIGTVGHDTLIHLLNFVPEKRGNSEIIEEGVTANQVLLKLRNPSRKQPKLLESLSGTSLSCRQNGDILEITLPTMTGYEIIKLVDF